jgi:hypothetical protein
MVRKSVRGVLAALFILANLALVAAPAGAGWDTRACITDDGEIGECCMSCWFFCDACEGMDDDDNEERN